VTADKPISEEAVVKALASGSDLASAEIAKVTGLARSTVGKALAALERDRMVRRDPGGRDGRRKLPDRWSLGSTDEHDTPTRSSTSRLRPGQLDELVRGYIDLVGKDAVETVDEVGDRGDRLGRPPLPSFTARSGSRAARGRTPASPHPDARGRLSVPTHRRSICSAAHPNSPRASGRSLDSPPGDCRAEPSRSAW
jgi:DNA-binding transcriptional ArsR family regulator